MRSKRLTITKINYPTEEQTMETPLYSVKDIKANHHLPPFISFNDATASRQFSTAVNQAGHEFNQHPADFQLFRIGLFESETATISKNDPTFLTDGSQQLQLPIIGGE